MCTVSLIPVCSLLSVYSAFVVILSNACQYQCYIDTRTDINRFSNRCVNRLKRIGAVDDGVISRPYSLTSRQSSSGDVVT